MKNAATNHPPKNDLGAIESESVYPWQILISRMGWTRASARAARRAGLPVRKVGKRQFVLERDVLAFIENSGKLV
jgi:hypothetical protein